MSSFTQTWIIILTLAALTVFVSSDEYKNEVVCEGGQMVLWCKRSTRVAIYSAMFGHIPNGSSLCETAEPSDVDCQAHNAVEAVRNQCHGRKQCVLEAEEYMFGDPCGLGINKYLNVTYTCVPKKVFKASHRKERKRHHRKKNRKKENKKDKKTKPLKGSSSETEVYTKYILPTTTSSYKTFTKTVTPRPEQASADAADSKATEHNRSDTGEHVKKGTASKEDKPVDSEATSSTVNLTVVCVNYTTVPVGQQKDRSMGILIDWFNTIDYLNRNLEKVVLYLALGVCLGIIILLTVILIKIGRDYKRSVRAKLDVTDPTHSHAVTSNHHPLEGSLDRAESIDRIEVVRFSPRGTLRTEGTRSLSNYYG